jgi:simple sugar transport system permease protein
MPGDEDMGWAVDVADLLGATFRLAAPVVLAAIGGLVSFHAGIMNVAMEGFMLISAFTAVLVSYYAGAWAGVLAAVAVCLVFSALYALFVVDLQSDGFAIGFALNILATGLTIYLVRILGTDIFNSPQIQPLPHLQIDALAASPILNSILNGHSVTVYITPVLVWAMSAVLYRTPFGAHLRAAGEAPAALAASGVSPRRVKYAASLICGALCGVAGAHLSLGYLTQFIRDMTAGRGFMALAAILVGRGRPAATALVSLLFAASEATSMKIQAYAAPQFALMLPYVVTIIAVTFLSGKPKKNVSSDTAAQAGE